MKCPRRFEIGQSGDGEDTWRADNTCSYCGSMNPDVFMQKAEAGVELGPTDKDYKVYVDGMNGKFYFQHLSEEQMKKFVELLNAKTLKIGYPGHFYTTPFFIHYPGR